MGVGLGGCGDDIGRVALLVSRNAWIVGWGAWGFWGRFWLWKGGVIELGVGGCFVDGACDGVRGRVRLIVWRVN